MVTLILRLSHGTYPLRLWIILKGRQIGLFMTSAICRCVYSILGINSLDRGRWVLPPRSLCNFSPLGMDAISVPGTEQDVLLHKRFPCWCCPVISFRVHNIMWRCGVPHNTTRYIWGARQCPVSPPTHTTKLRCSSTLKAVFTDGVKSKGAFCIPVPGVIWIF